MFPTLRILQVHTRYRERGGEDSVVDVERSILTEGGHDVVLHLETNPSRAVPALGSLLASPWNPSASRRVVDAARAHKADIVHVHNTWFALSPAVFPALGKAGFPTVATTHNYRLGCVDASFYRDGAPCDDCLGKSPWRGVVHGCYHDSRAQSAVVAVNIASHRGMGTWDRHPDVMIALTEFGADRLVMSGVPREKIVVKSNSVGDPGPRTLKPSESDTVVFVGRLTEIKGIQDLLSAWEASAPPGLRLAVAGSGPLGPELERALPSGVKMVGRLEREETDELLLRARALVFPSRWYEGQPMTLIESMAAATPPVVPRLGAMPEVVGAAGIVYDREMGLGGALASLDDGDRLDRLSRAARTRYETAFHPNVALENLESVYRRAIGSEPGDS